MSVSRDHPPSAPVHQAQARHTAPQPNAIHWLSAGKKRSQSLTADSSADTVTHTSYSHVHAPLTADFSGSANFEKGKRSPSRKHRSSPRRQAGEVVLKRANGLFTTLCKPHTPCMPHDPISICSCLLFSPAALTGPGQAVYWACIHTHAQKVMSMLLQGFFLIIIISN